MLTGILSLVRGFTLGLYLIIDGIVTWVWDGKSEDFHFLDSTVGHRRCKLFRFPRILDTSERKNIVYYICHYTHEVKRREHTSERSPQEEESRAGFVSLRVRLEPHSH